MTLGLLPSVYHFPELMVSNVIVACSIFLAPFPLFLHPYHFLRILRTNSSLTSAFYREKWKNSLCHRNGSNILWPRKLSCSIFDHNFSSSSITSYPNHISNFFADLLYTRDDRNWKGKKKKNCATVQELRLNFIFTTILSFDNTKETIRGCNIHIFPLFTLRGYKNWKLLVDILLAAWKKEKKYVLTFWFAT